MMRNPFLILLLFQFFLYAQQNTNQFKENDELFTRDCTKYQYDTVNIPVALNEYIYQNYIPPGICDDDDDDLSVLFPASTYFTEEDMKYIKENKNPNSKKYEFNKGKKVFTFEWNTTNSVEFENLKKLSANLKKVSFELEFENCSLVAYKIDYKKGRKKYHFRVIDDLVNKTYLSELGYGHKTIISESSAEYYINGVLRSSKLCDFELNKDYWNDFYYNGNKKYKSVKSYYEDGFSIQENFYSENGIYVAISKGSDKTINDKVVKFDIFKNTSDNEQEFFASFSINMSKYNHVDEIFYLINNYKQ